MTTARVAYSSVLSIPLKALAESAALPGRPGDVHAQPASAGIGDLPDRVDEIGRAVPALVAQIGRDNALAYFIRRPDGTDAMRNVAERLFIRLLMP